MFDIERRDENTELFFPLCFLGFLISVCSYVVTAWKIREWSRPKRRDETARDATSRGRGRADGPRGALGFHYAKPQMESLRSSVSPRPPSEAHNGAGIRLLRCNVTQKLNSPVFSLVGAHTRSRRRLFARGPPTMRRTLVTRELVTVAFRNIATKVPTGMTLELFTWESICDDDFCGFS